MKFVPPIWAYSIIEISMLTCRLILSKLKKHKKSEIRVILYRFGALNSTPKQDEVKAGMVFWKMRITLLACRSNASKSTYQQGEVARGKKCVFPI